MPDVWSPGTGRGRRIFATLTSLRRVTTTAPATSAIGRSPLHAWRIHTAHRTARARASVLQRPRWFVWKQQLVSDAGRRGGVSAAYWELSPARTRGLAALNRLKGLRHTPHSSRRNGAGQVAPTSRYSGRMDDERRRSRRALPLFSLAAVLVIGAYVAAYFALSEVRVRQGPNGPIESRTFGSKGALSLFRPLTWVESRFMDERGFSHRP